MKVKVEFLAVNELWSRFLWNGMPTEGAYSSGDLVLSHFGSCKCSKSNVETNLSWTCLVSGLLSFEHPSVLLFLLLMKRYQFYREARLTCYLYRQTEDICIGICVFKRVFNVWYMLKKSVSMQQHFEQFVGKQWRLEGYFWSWTTKVCLCKSVFIGWAV